MFRRAGGRLPYGGSGILLSLAVKTHTHTGAPHPCGSNGPLPKVDCTFDIPAIFQIKVVWCFVPCFYALFMFVFVALLHNQLPSEGNKVESSVELKIYFGGFLEGKISCSAKVIMVNPRVGKAYPGSPLVHKT